MNWWLLASALISGLAIFWVQRVAAKADKEQDKAENRQKALEDRLSRLEMKVAADMPTKEDFKDQSRRMESIEATLHEVRDMVIRMDAREEKR